MLIFLFLLFTIGVILTSSALAAYNRAHLARDIFPLDNETPEKNGNDWMERAAILQSGLISLYAFFWLALGAVSFALLAFTFPTLSPPPHPVWLLLALLVVFLVERLIYSACLRRSESCARTLAPLARGVVFFARPPHIVMEWVARMITSEETPSAQDVEEEIMELVDSGQEEGSLETEKGRLIHSIFDFSDTYAREIMVPRVDIVALEINMDLSEAVEILVRSGHSRLPLYRETIDQIVGLIYAKDILRVWSKDQKEIALSSLARPVYFIPETKRINQLLTEMQQRRIHMAVVVDEYGGVAGLVTLEDIIEELIGEIQDEFDQGEELPYQKLDDQQTLFLGKIDLDDFNDIMGTNLPKEETDTLGGYIYNQLGRTPTNGEQLTIGNIQLTIEQVSGQRIRKVRAQRLETGEEQNEPSHQ